MPRSRKRYAQSVPNEVRSTIGPEDWLEKALADPAFAEPHTMQTETRGNQFIYDPDESLIERRKLAFWRERHAVLIAATWGLQVSESGEEEAEDD